MVSCVQLNKAKCLEWLQTTEGLRIFSSKDACDFYQSVIRARQAQLETTPELAPPAPSAQPAPVPAVFAGPSVAAPASAETAEAALAPAAAPTSAEATSATDKFPLEHQPATQPAATQLKALSKEDRRLECAALARKARSEKV